MNVVFYNQEYPKMTIQVILLMLFTRITSAAGVNVDFELSRTSPAFFGDQNSMMEFAPNQLRQKTIAICGVSDGQYVIGEANGVTLFPWAIGGDYMYASGPGSQGIYRRKINGYEISQWECMNNSVNYIKRIWGLKNGDIIVVIGGSLPYQVYYSNDCGQTLIKKLELSTWATVNTFSFYEAHNGTGILGEYGVPPNNHGRFLYRWDPNEKTFSMVYDSFPDYIIFHFHAICKQETLGRWIASAGDDVYRRMVYSDDDGLSWHQLTTANQIDMQPVAFYDYGHPTNILFGSDRYWMFGTVDISGQTIDNNDIKELIFSWGRKASTNYCRGILYYNGIYYAASYDNSSGTSINPVIMVSKDLINWAVYHQFKNNEKGVLFIVGAAGGKIHCTVNDKNSVWRHFQISPVDNVATCTSAILEPAATNLLDNIDASSAEASGFNWYGSGLVYSRDTSVSHHGQASFILTAPGKTSILARSDCINVTEGKTYIGRLWIRGNNCHNVHCEYVNGSSYTEYGERAYCHPSPNYWQELVLNPYTVPSGQTKLGIRLTAAGLDGLTVNVDSLQITEVPTSSWQIGGSNRADEILNYLTNITGQWTNTFTFLPETAYNFYYKPDSTQKFYIKSWKAGNCLSELFYQPGADPNQTEGIFILSVRNGVEAFQLETGKQKFISQGQIKFAVVCSSDNAGKVKLALYSSCGSPIETVVSDWTDIAADLAQQNISGSFGDVNRVNIFPGSFAQDQFFNTAFDYQQIEEAFSTDFNGGPTACDINFDGTVDMKDIATLGIYWMNDDCDALTDCQGADITKDGKVDDLDLKIIVNNWLLSEL